MIVVNGLRGDMILEATLRSDLAPIPLTFEGHIRTTAQTAVDFQDGKTITVNETQFRIVKSEPVNNAGGGTVGDKPLSAVSIIALPEACWAVARPRQSAVIFDSATLSGIYRACGATTPVTGDFSVGRFAALVGETPTFQIARILQEESAAMMWRGGALRVMRLRELLAQPASGELQEDNSEDIRSGFLEAGEVPQYVSTGDDGGFIVGARRNPYQAVEYTPNKSDRQVNFMSRVLSRRKVSKAKLDITKRAGDVISVRGTPMVIMTAAHVLKAGTDGGPADQYTRLWLGVST